MNTFDELRSAVAGHLKANRRVAEDKMSEAKKKIDAHQHGSLCSVWCVENFWRLRYLRAEQQALLWAKYEAAIRFGTRQEVAAAVEMVLPHFRIGISHYLMLLNTQTPGFALMAFAYCRGVHNDMRDLSERLRDGLHPIHC